MPWTASAPPKTKTITVGTDKKKTKVKISYFPEAKTFVEEINGTRNVRYFERSTAIVGGRWFCVGFYGLATAAWNGKTWEVLVDEQRGEAILATKDTRMDAVATDGTRAWAVSTAGGVFEWNGETWKALAKTGGPEFAKQRRFTRLAWDSAKQRLVLWGGDNGNRASNDTLIFEGGKWRKSAKPGTKLASRKADNYWMYDDGKQIVRVGADGCHALDGDAWKPLAHPAPKFVSGDNDASVAQIVIAHGPQTQWIDPLAGAVYREGGRKPTGDIGLPPGLVSSAVLKAAGGYFWNDFEDVNETQWLWAWDPAKRRIYGMHLGSSKYVCHLELPA